MAVWGCFDAIGAEADPSGWPKFPCEGGLMSKAPTPVRSERELGRRQCPDTTPRQLASRYGACWTLREGSV